jgi:hypothetical protein
MTQKEDHWILRLLLIIILPIVFYYVAITHRFGPYQGIVFDGETGEPIEGAVVLVAFRTEMVASPGGPVSRFVDAVEVLTDRNGEFKIDQRCWVLRFPHRWNPDCFVTIFKPSYGCFPWHKDSYPTYYPVYSIPADQYLAIGLPKLETIEERRRNLDILLYPDAPGEKMKYLYRMVSIERGNVGLTP